MYIKHIILDGFKSYKERTDIGPFDPHFNAITGLNGSGKSNILDAICFVLGLSSLNVVRAANLAELVYKGGSTGVTRASASIVFDNRDKSKCPVGYEKFDEIIVSRTVEAQGTCKYFLNSITSTKKAITDLFESVQLNISNPNFMIMQGKITKVIAMSPKQILMMIEETVGGNVYQNKRDKAEQELVNKERCLASTRGIIEGDIYPEYKRQRDAREKLAEFQSVEHRRARVSKYFSILLYQDLATHLQSGEIELQAILEKEAEDNERTDECKKAIEGNKKRQQQMKKENVEKFKDRIEQAEKVLNSEKKQFMTVEAKLNSAKMDIEDANKKVKETEQEKAKQEKEMQDYKKKSASTVGEFEAVKAEIQTAEANLTKAKEQENALKLGNIVDEDGNTCDARGELMRVEDEINKIQPDYEVSDQQYKEDQQKLKGLERELKNTPSDDQVERDYNTKFQKVEQLKREAVNRNINPDDSTHEIVRQLNANKQRMDGLEREKNRIWNQNHYLSLQYNKQKVDSSKIHGCMYELIKFKNKEEWGGALGVLAGGVLGQVIVEDVECGKALLKSDLSRRITLHPLSIFKNMNRRTVTQQELDRRLGPGKAIPALDVMECDAKYQPILQHFFGGKVLCDTLITAQKAAFDLGFYAVSKLGDAVDPDGVMSGGARKDLGQLIETCDQLRQICGELKHLYGSSGDLQRRLQVAKTNEEFMKTLEIAKRDLHNAEETRKLTKHSMMKQELDNLKAKLQQESEKLKEWKQTLDKFEKERRAWKTKVDQIENLREKNKKDNAALITRCEKALEAAKKKYDAKQKHFTDIDVDIKSREALIADCQKDIEAALGEKAEYEKDLLKITDKFKEAQRKFKETQAVYDEAVAESNQWNEEYNKIEEEIRELTNAIHKIDLEKIKRNNVKEKVQATVDRSKAELKDLQNTHKTVNFETETIPPEEKKSLGALKAELAKLNQNHEKLRERIDQNAAEQCEGTKSLLQDAESKIKKIEKNRDDLQRCIDKLDAHKLSIVVQAYDKVNSEFNKMMSTLLPESEARLVPVNKDDLMQGLNIHVRLGGVWKESLSELSGGQKSLVALALVLSLCMYNSAPFYILDEIDSALDLNHTQNIGVLIKRKFTGTQFICVSLKDGMYSNCNILFQVQFINGKSEVKRCVRQSSKKTKEDNEVVAYGKHKSSKRSRHV